MPAITRSQSNKMSVNIPQDETTFFTKLIPTKVSPTKEKSMSQSQVDRNKSTFVSYMNKMIAKSDSLYNDGRVFKMEAAKSNTNEIRDFYLRSYKQTYFNNVRVITEIYYSVVDWFDTVFVINGVVPTPSMQKLINIIYERSFEFVKQIYDGPSDRTDEEQYIVKVLLNQLEETRALLEPYVTTNKPLNATARPKRSRAAVDYTGMDTVEPLNEYDGMTNIWADYTIYEDPDYEPEEDEDDDEEDDDYEPEEEDEDDDYELEEEDEDEYEEDDEDEDYEPEEEDEDDDFSGAKDESFKIERVSSNHIRFVY